MKELLVSATAHEIKPFLDKLAVNESGNFYEFDKFDILITGVGILACCYNLSRILALKKYSNIINFGIAGSFKKEIPKKSLVCVTCEEFADIGAENGESDYIDLFDMNLLSPDEAPFKNKKLVPVKPGFFSEFTSIRESNAVTVSRVLSHTQSIRYVEKRYNPDVVSMEGAAVFYAAILNSTPCIQIRSISDYVETRDKSQWDIPGSISALNKVIIEFYESRYLLP